MLLFCFRLKIDLYYRICLVLLTFCLLGQRQANHQQRPTLSLFPMDTQLKVCMIASKNILFRNCQCKFQSHFMIHAFRFASDCFVPLTLWHLSVKSSLASISEVINSASGHICCLCPFRSLCCVHR